MSVSSKTALIVWKEFAGLPSHSGAVPSHIPGPRPDMVQFRTELPPDSRWVPKLQLYVAVDAKS